jgi:hypothetical protein
MKKATTLLIVILFVLAGCSEGKQSGNKNNDLFIVDVTASYPKKEMILQDIMDVEYVPLDESDEFVTTGWVHAIGKEVIVVRNRNRNTDGDILLFDRKGKGLRKINHLGGGGEEYQFLLGITLDEENNEIFVNDHFSEKIVVYDLFGNFKRSFKHKKGSMYNMEVYNFDRNNLICRDDKFGENGLGNKNIFLVVSKQDGSITKEIEIPYKEKVSSMIFGDRGVMGIRNRVLVPQGNNSWTLMENSTDTIFQYMSDFSMIPIIIRTPAIQSMATKVLLYPAVLTDRYVFMQTVKAEWDWERNVGHDRRNLMYDKKENATYEYEMFNADYTKKQPVIMTSEVTFGNGEVAAVQVLEAFQLVESNEKGELKGKLKDIAAKLKDDSNPVIMLIKHKK